LKQGIFQGGGGPTGHTKKKEKVPERVDSAVNELRSGTSKGFWLWRRRPHRISTTTLDNHTPKKKKQESSSPFKPIGKASLGEGPKTLKKKKSVWLVGEEGLQIDLTSPQGSNRRGEDPQTTATVGLRARKKGLGQGPKRKKTD